MATDVGTANDQSSIAHAEEVIRAAGADVQRFVQESGGAEEIKRRATGAADAEKRERAGAEQVAKYSDSEADALGNIAGDAVLGTSTVKTAIDLGATSFADIRKTGDDGQSRDAHKFVQKGLAQNPQGLFSKIETSLKGRTPAEKINGSIDSLKKFAETTSNVKANEECAQQMQNVAKVGIVYSKANEMALAGARQVLNSAPAPIAGLGSGTRISTLQQAQRNPDEVLEKHGVQTQQQINAVKAPELALDKMAPNPPLFKNDVTDDDSWVT